MSLNTSGHRRLHCPSRARERPLHSLVGCTTVVKAEPWMPGQVTKPSVSNNDSHKIGTEAFAASTGTPGVHPVMLGWGIGGVQGQEHRTVGHVLSLIGCSWAEPDSLTVVSWLRRLVP